MHRPSPLPVLAEMLLAAMLLAACGHGPPPAPPPRQLPAASIGAIAGTWATSGELDWEYKMVISAPGTIDFTIDRGTAGRCEQVGSIAPKTDRVFDVTYTRGNCNHDVVGHPLELTIASFTGKAITVEVAGERRTYAFVPPP